MVLALIAFGRDVLEALFVVYVASGTARWANV